VAKADQPVRTLRGEAQLAAPPQPVAVDATVALTEQTLPDVWSRVLGMLGGMFAAHLEKARERIIAPPNTLVLRFSASYNQDRDFCAEAARVTRVEEALKKVTGRPWNLRFETIPGDPAAEPAPASADNKPSRSRRQREEAEREPLVKRAIEKLEAQIVSVDEGFGALPGDGPERPAATDTEET
jgi:DNA polymerase III subunit gamma/tau